MKSLAWLTALPLLAAPAAPPTDGVSDGRAAHGGWLVLPGAVEPAVLQARIANDPPSWLVLDVRAADAWREFHVPGAEPVDLAALPSRLRAVPATARVVIVDRDGTQAYAVAGAAHVALGPAAPNLSVLAGGTLRWWREIEHPTRARANAKPTADGPSPHPGPSAPADLHPTNATPRPRSAGC